MIIASFPKGSYPEYTWPIGTWPEAPEAAVDIVYTEVFEFTLAIAATAEFEVVLPNDASVDVGTSGDMIVSGAGSTVVNGTYDYQGLVYGKAWYYKADADMIFMWTPAPGNYWSVNNIYKSYDDVATPDLCTTWELGLGGVLPLPTVTAGATATLTEVAAFTVEMPTVISMEVYEELSL